MKQCSHCKSIKHSIEFSKDSKNSDGLYSWCKKCKAASRAKRYSEQRLNDPYTSWCRRTINWARGRKKFEVTVDHRDILTLLIDQDYQCIYCRKKLNFAAVMHQRIDSPSMDRLDPKEGYTHRNIVISCYRCNQIKSDATVEELMNIAKRVSQLLHLE